MHPKIEAFAPQWADYELIDCGGFEKIERFGKFITIRPEPQAVWSKQLPEHEWIHMAHVKFVQESSSNGKWIQLKTTPLNWNIAYKSKQIDIKFKLALTAFKHLGVFPEQASNWEFIHSQIKQLNMHQPKVLNLFAYTGGASLVSKQAGADIIHLDSIKQVVSWARNNMELSNLKDIRWLVEDAKKFVMREVKRGNKYNGIILDPPAYGLGPNGERWILEEQIDELMDLVSKILVKDKSFVVLNAYSLGFSALIIQNLFNNYFPGQKNQIGELYLQSKTNMLLPLGVFGRKFIN